MEMTNLKIGRIQVTFVLLVVLSRTTRCRDVTYQQVLSSQSDYGIVIDAGSSGTRMRIYGWPSGSWSTQTRDVDLPRITELLQRSNNTGMSHYVHNHDGLAKHLQYFLDIAKQSIPRDSYRQTSVFAFATAGMRLLLAHDANRVINEVDRLMTDASFNPFQYVTSNTRIISGEEEGAFAWIALNYLRNYFSHGKRPPHQSGILELGGASAQIAFQHNGSILADKFPVMIRQEIYPLYVHSYLGFGQNMVQDRLDALIYKRHQHQLARDGYITSPCMLKDDVRSVTIDGNGTVRFEGSSDPVECLKHIKHIVYKTPHADKCLPKPCAIGSVYQPAISRHTDFFTLSSVFKYTLNTINVPRTNEGRYCLHETQTAAINFCSLNKSQAIVAAGKPAHKANFLSTECMMGLYIPVLLTKGLLFSNDSCQVLQQDIVNGQKAEWTLGALIYEMERRSAGCQVSASSITRTQDSKLLFILCLATFYTLSKS